MKQAGKRITGLLAACALLVALMPGTVWAADTGNDADGGREWPPQASESEAGPSTNAGSGADEENLPEEAPAQISTGNGSPAKAAEPAAPENPAQAPGGPIEDEDNLPGEKPGPGGTTPEGEPTFQRTGGTSTFQATSTINLLAGDNALLAAAASDDTWDYDATNKVITLYDGANVKVEEGHFSVRVPRLVIAAGATVLVELRDVTIMNLVYGVTEPAILLEPGADATFTHDFGNVILAGGNNNAGIHAPAGTSVTIMGGTNTFSVLGYGGSAGIGGVAGQDGGDVTIAGKPVSATGTGTGADIGGGAGAGGGTLTVRDGATVTMGNNGTTAACSFYECTIDGQGAQATGIDGTYSWLTVENGASRPVDDNSWNPAWASEAGKQIVRSGQAVQLTLGNQAGPGMTMVWKLLEGSAIIDDAGRFTMPDGPVRIEGVEMRASSRAFLNLGEMEDDLYAAGENAENWEFDKLTKTITITGDVTLTGSTTTRTVVVANDAIITLDDIGIDMSLTPGAVPLLLQNGVRATLQMEPGSENTVAGGEDCPGLAVPAGTALTIQGGGGLTATGGENGAGIGGAAGTAAGEIFILGADTSVIAIAGENAQDVGSGSGSDNGGSLTVAHGAALQLYTGTTNQATGGLSLTNCTVSYGSTAAVAIVYGRAKNLPTHTYIELDTVDVGDGETVGFNLQHPNAPEPVKLVRDADSTFTGYTITTSSQATIHYVQVVDGVKTNVTLDGVDIVTHTGKAAMALQGTAQVTLYLAGGSVNSLKGSGDNAGLEVFDDAALTIEGATGRLVATGGQDGAGIGGAYSKIGGAITINGGIIEATGGSGGGAGIGAGNLTLAGDGPNISITGGTVTATGQNGGAGIGSGSSGSNSKPAINISGGIVYANGGQPRTSNSGSGGAGIGGGGSNAGGTINISGGIIEATGGDAGSAAQNGGGSGIGGGGNATGAATINITGGTVTATAGNTTGTGSQGIGSGYMAMGKCSITIGGASTLVTATGTNTLDIGSSFANSDSLLIHNGATVNLEAGGVRNTAKLGECTIGGANPIESTGKSIAGVYAWLTVVEGSALPDGENAWPVMWLTDEGGDDQRQIVRHGTDVSLTLDPISPEYFFMGLDIIPSGLAVTGGNSVYAFTMPGEAVRIAPIINYPITITQTTGGTVVANQSNAPEGATISLTVTADDSYQLAGWSTAPVGISVTGSGMAYSFTMPGEGITLAAAFEKIPLAFAGLPENNTVQVGDKITLTPTVDYQTGSTGWTWDSEYFSATFNSPATFTALKAGSSTITFTDTDGRTISASITIQATDDGGDKPGTDDGDKPGTDDGDKPGTDGGDKPGTDGGDKPGTNNTHNAIANTGDSSHVWLYTVLAAMAAALAGRLVWYKRRKSKQ